MNHYKYYSVEDFVQDLRFRTWVKNASREEDLLWQNWLRENRQKQDVIEEARAIVLSIHPVEHESISDREIQLEVENILARINEDEEDINQTVPVNRSSFSLALKVAASIALIIAGSWYGVRSLKSNEPLNATENHVLAANFMIERINKSDDTLLINLPDKSSILLAQNSTIRYPKEFNGQTRDVFLEGTAFFEVTKNPKKPFYVNAGNIIAKVLGTSFEISTDLEDSEVRVIVKSGTVSIYCNPDQDKKDLGNEPNVILTENEQFLYNEKNVSKLEHTRLDSSSIRKLSVPDTYRTFSGTPITEVFASFSKAYGVKINYDHAQIQDCSVTASFTDEPFTLKLDLICRSIGVKYEIVNDEVAITGNGCKN